MKQFITISLLLFLAIGITKCGNSSEIVESLDLPEEVRNDLLFLLEEEKLARDVYIYAYNMYGENIFNNISGSEQRHMDAAKVILEKYNIPINMSEEIGVFINTDIQSLYDEYIAKVDLSLVDALMIGATIEDLDIYDINTYKSRATKDDILRMYNLLACGSGNHMRAFISQITANGAIYSPQFLTQEEYDLVLNTEHQSCGQIYRRKW